MQKRLSRKLLLSRETLRALNHFALDQVKGGGTTATTGGSVVSDSCASCVTCSVSERNSVCDTYCNC
jgi:hypothetical protein